MFDVFDEEPITIEESTTKTQWEVGLTQFQQGIIVVSISIGILIWHV